MRSKCNYIRGNISDVDYNAYYEAEGPFVCIYVEKPDEFVLIWSVLHVGFSCVLEQLSTKIS